MFDSAIRFAESPSVSAGFGGDSKFESQLHDVATFQVIANQNARFHAGEKSISGPQSLLKKERKKCKRQNCAW